MNTIELETFVPAKHFEVSKEFYQDPGFTLASDSDGIADVHHENVSFLLQGFYVRELAENFMMHLPIESVEAWREKLCERNIYLPLHGRGPSRPPEAPRPSLRLRLDLLGEISRQPNLGDRGELPLKVIDMLF